MLDDLVFVFDVVVTWEEKDSLLRKTGEEEIKVPFYFSWRNFYGKDDCN